MLIYLFKDFVSSGSPEVVCQVSTFYYVWVWSKNLWWWWWWVVVVGGGGGGWWLVLVFVVGGGIPSISSVPLF